MVLEIDGWSHGKIAKWRIANGGRQNGGRRLAEGGSGLAVRTPQANFILIAYKNNNQIEQLK